MTKAPKEVLYICQYVIAETDTFEHRNYHNSYQYEWIQLQLSERFHDRESNECYDNFYADEESLFTRYLMRRQK